MIFNITSTSLTISNRLEGVQYSYTVAVVDGANRSGPQSNSGCFNLDSKFFIIIILLLTTYIAPEQVPALTAMTTDFSENLTQVDATVNISVQWMVSTVYIIIHKIVYLCNILFSNLPHHVLVLM